MGFGFAARFLTLLLLVVSWTPPGQLPQGTFAFIPICNLQGSGFSTPYGGQSVSTTGVVIADLDTTWVRGFYIQAANCDALESTSDGIFVYLGEKIDVVQTGDSVQVTGVVQEYYGLTEVISSAAQVIILAHNQVLPPLTLINPPLENAASRVYFEAREGMRSGLNEALVVGPTDADERSWLVHPDWGISHVFEDDPAGTGELICVDDAGLFSISPQVKVGDRVLQIQGVLDFRFAAYCIQLTAQPVVEQAPFPVLPAQVELGDEKVPVSKPNLGETLPIFRLGTYNLANLFDTLDDPNTADSVLSATEYQRRLEKHALAVHNALQEPEILAVQEVENAQVLADLLARPEIQADYAYWIQDGPDRRGIDVALLYRSDRVLLDFALARQGCSLLVDGLGPDGNLDVLNPANNITCDTNQDGVMDGNRLFSRPPLLAKLKICQPSCPSTTYQTFWIINNHLKSKSEDTTATAYTLPRRVEQAQFLVRLVNEILATDPHANLAVVGDLNDTPSSQPLSALKSSGLFEALNVADRQTHYTYIYQGLAQTIDYVMLRSNPGWGALAAQPYHLNADFPVGMSALPGVYWRSSDHDPLVVSWGMVGHLVFLPMLRR